MNTILLRVFLIFCLCGGFTAEIVSQSSNSDTGRPKKKNRRAPTPTPTPVVAVDDGEVIDSDEVISIDTSVVSIPVKVLDRDGRFVPGLKKTDFRLYEDGQEQQIEFFGNEQVPFTVALVLDMSYSAVFRIDEIQQAALQFVTELKPNDRVMVVAFSRGIDVLTEITSDRRKINSAIIRTRIGSGGTSVYDTVDFVLKKKFNGIKGRKAVVLFSDGVDTTSEEVTDRDNLRETMESEVLFYPIWYDTFRDVQDIESGRVVVNDPNKTTTPPIGGGGIPGSTTGLPVPFPTIGVGRDRRRDDRSRPCDPQDASRRCDVNAPPVSSDPRDRPSVLRTGTSREEYKIAREYLDGLANRTGGRLFEAQKNRSLAKVFSKIAAELREYYNIGYYPADASNTKRSRKLKVKVNRKKVSVRTRNSIRLKPRKEK